MAREFTLERLSGAHFVGVPTVAMSQSNITEPFAGRADIASGSSTVVVSSTLVQSDSIVQSTVQRATDVVSLAAQPAPNIVVRSLNPGVGMVFGTADGTGVEDTTTVMWQLYRT